MQFSPHASTTHNLPFLLQFLLVSLLFLLSLQQEQQHVIASTTPVLPLQLDWVMSSLPNTYIKSITMNNQEQIVVAGYYYGSNLTLGNTTLLNRDTSGLTSDTFVAWMDKSGNWVYPLISLVNSLSNDVISVVKQDGENLIVAGSQGTMCFVTRLTPQFTTPYVYVISMTQSCSVSDILLVPNDGIYVAARDSQSMIVKKLKWLLDAQQWTFSNPYVGGYFLSITLQDNALFLTGGIPPNITIGSQVLSSPYNETSSFIAKLSTSDGSVQSARILESQSNVVCTGIKVIADSDPSNIIVLARCPSQVRIFKLSTMSLNLVANMNLSSTNINPSDIMVHPSDSDCLIVLGGHGGNMTDGTGKIILGDVPAEAFVVQMRWSTNLLAVPAMGFGYPIRNYPSVSMTLGMDGDLFVAGSIDKRTSYWSSQPIPLSQESLYVARFYFSNTLARKPLLILDADITSNTQFTSAFQYAVSRSITVNNLQLNITKGCSFLMNPGTLISLTNGTTALFEGTEADPIVFTAKNTTLGYRGLYIDSGSSLALSYISIISAGRHPDKTKNSDLAAIRNEGKLTVWRSTIALSFNHAITSDSIEPLVVRYSNFTQNYGAAVVSGSCPSVIIQYNTMTGFVGVSIGEIQVTEITITHNTMDTSASGVLINNPFMAVKNNFVIVENNSIRSGSTVFISIPSDRIAVNNNIINRTKGSQAHALKISNQGFGITQIMNNTVYETSYIVLYAYSFNCSLMDISGNVFYTDYTTQSFLITLRDGCPNTRFTDNTFYINFAMKGPQTALAVRSNSVIQRNKFFNVGEGSVLKPFLNVTINAQYNYWGQDMMDCASVDRLISNTVGASILYSPVASDSSLTNFRWFDLFSIDKLFSIGDCAGIQRYWSTAPSGTYRINPACTPIIVYCNMDENGQVVIQRRIDGSTSFDRTLVEYTTGFGNLEAEFFAGLDTIRSITSLGTHLRVSIENDVGSYTAVYDRFNIESDSSLVLGGFSSMDMSDEFSIHNGSLFTVGNSGAGGWWHTVSDEVNLNGLYKSGMFWGSVELLAKTTMEIGLSNLDFECKPQITLKGNLNPAFCDSFDVQAEVRYPSDNYTIIWTFSNPDFQQFVTPDSKRVSIPSSFMNITMTYTVTVSINIFPNVNSTYQFKRSHPTVDMNIVSVSPSVLTVYNDVGTIGFRVSIENVSPCVASVMKQWAIGTRKPFLSSALSTDMYYSVLVDDLGTLILPINVMFENMIFSKNATVNVVPQPSNALIYGGDKRIPQNYPLQLDGSYSTPRLNNTVGIYTWSCDKCINFAPSNQQVVTFQENIPTNYTVSLTYRPSVSASYMSSKTFTVIEVTKQKENTLVTSILTLVPKLISAQKVLKLEGSVNVKEGIEFEWIIRNDDTGGSLSNGWRPQLYPLIIDRGQLYPSTRYTLTLRTRYFNSTEISFAYVSTITDQAPVLHNMTINPSSGIELETQFTISVESHNASRFSFYYMNELQDMIPLKLYSDSSYLSTVLPHGYTKDNRLRVVCASESFLGTVSYINTTVLVTISPQVDLDSMVSNLTSGSANKELLLNLLSDAIHQGASNSTSANQTARISTIVEQVLDFLTDDISNEISQIQSLTKGSIESKVTIIETLTRNPSVLRSKSANTALQSIQVIMDSILSQNSQDLDLSNSNMDKIASSISNIYVSNKIHMNSSESTLGPITKLRRIIASNLIASENGTTISTEAFDVVVKLDYADRFANSTFSSSKSNVFLPQGVSSQLNNSSVYTMEFISFGEMNPYTWSNSSSNITSSVISFKLIINEEKVPLKNMKEPIEIILQKMRNASNDQQQSTDYSTACFYWDDRSNETWQTVGCSLFSEDDSTITCHCTHTTSFSAMVIYDPKHPSKYSEGLYITWIAVHSVFALTCICLIILSFLWRGEQPIRSRFLSPYLGLLSITLESILNGIIRNSLLISSPTVNKYYSINAIAYVIMTLVNPIVLTAMFIYFWQMMRYIFMKNLYAIMGIEKRNSAKLLILKVLASKRVYIGVALTIYCLSCAYFVVLSIIEATVMKANTASTFNALSFASMSYAIAILIVCAFVWDMVVMLLRKMSLGKKIIPENGDEPPHPIVSALMSHFTRNDPLLFRTESIFMTGAMILMLISYSIGIGDRFDPHAKPNSPAKIIEFIFDVCYFALRIVAFGGYILFVHAIHRFKYGDQRKKYVELKQSMKNEDSKTSQMETELLMMLRDDFGYSAFYSYCKKEFALENLLLWKRLEKLRSDNVVTEDSHRKHELKILLDLFISRTAEYEVNISSKCKKGFTELMMREVITAQDAERVLLSLFNETMLNICDTFTRYSSTPQYQQYQQANIMSRKLENVYN